MAQAMTWKDIAKVKPLNGSLIMVYHPDMDAKECIKEGIWFLMHWNEKESKAYDHSNDKYFEITHWCSFPLLPKE